MSFENISRTSRRARCRDVRTARSAVCRGSGLLRQPPPSAGPRLALVSVEFIEVRNEPVGDRRRERGVAYGYAEANDARLVVGNHGNQFGELLHTARQAVRAIAPADS